MIWPTLRWLVCLCLTSVLLLDDIVRWEGLVSRNWCVLLAFELLSDSLETSLCYLLPLGLLSDVKDFRTDLVKALHHVFVLSLYDP